MTNTPSRIRMSRRVTEIETSPTMLVMNRAAELSRSGVDVVDFGPGEPDFATPGSVCDAAKKAIDDGLTKYTSALGTNELREAIAASYNRRYSTKLTREHVIAGSGGKQELFNLALALVEAGDEVVIPAPFWVSFPDQIRFAGGVPVFADCSASNGFRPTFETLTGKFTGKTRGVILNSPCNPSGAVIERGELDRIIRFCAERGVFVIFDETYEFFVYDGAEHVSAIEWFHEFPETVIIVNSMSKTYSMTGWRLGFALAHPEIIRAVGKIQSHSTTNPSSISQAAAIAALSGSGDEVQKMFDAYQERRRWIVPALNAIQGIECRMPDGAFYVFPDVSALFGNGSVHDSASFADYLLEHARVAVVPGSAFGSEGFVRISYATSIERIREGVNRIEAAVTRLRAAVSES